MNTDERDNPRDALDELIGTFVGDDPQRLLLLNEEIVNVEVAQLVYDLRTREGLSQREFAKRVGTTESVICRVEQADYEGSLGVLKKIKRRTI